MATTLTKIDSTCSNIQLIDENICLGDSLSTLNSNFINLSSSLNNLTKNINSWDNTLTLFYVNSSLMIQTMLNIQSINDACASPYTTLQLLSSQWGTKIFSLYYPTFYELTNFVNSESTYQNQILSWLNSNFSPSSFSENQKINVFVSLYFTNRFVFSFQANYQESCSPNYHTDAVITCDGCSSGAYAGCNHDAGGKHWCDNAYSYCEKTLISDKETYTCQGAASTTYDWVTVDNDPNGNYTPTSNNVAAGNLNIDYKRNGYDTFITRVVSYTYQNINSQWIKL